MRHIRAQLGLLALTALLVFAGCRDFHETLPFDQCQPFALTCPGCTFEADRSEDSGRTRVWRCGTDAGEYDAVTRRAANVAAFDTRFYDLETGTRAASVRTHDAPVEICGQLVTDEWYGDILDCTPTCEHEPDDGGADPVLDACDSAPPTR